MFHTHKIELDLDFNNWTETAEKYSADLGVKYELLQEVGPAGGNPLVRFTGPHNAIKTLAFVHLAEDDHDWVLSLIEPLAAYA